MDLNKKQNDRISKFFKELTKFATEVDPKRVSSVEQVEIIIRSMYNQGHRRYHNIKHINSCLKRLKEYRRETKSQESNCENLLKFAILTHDIILIPGSMENEIHSVFVAKALIQQLGVRLFNDMDPQDIVNELESLIYVTSHAMAPNSLHREHCSEAIIADCDLAILSSDPETYRRYDKNIKKEYGTLRDSYYYRGRYQFLKQILNKPNIFWTEYFKDTLEQQARENIKENIERIKSKIQL